MSNANHQYESLSEVHQSVDTTSLKRKGWRKILAFFGPAYLVSVAIWIRETGLPILQAEANLAIS